MAPWLVGLLAGDEPNPAMAMLPFVDELKRRYRVRGVDGLATMPHEWWAELGAIGTLDDAAHHLGRLGEAGAHSIGLWPSPDPATAREDLQTVLRLSAAR
jgi:hypothetical protein